jgi:predicted ABC-type ATPase
MTTFLRVAERVAHGRHNLSLPVLERRFPRNIRLLLNAHAPELEVAMHYPGLLVPTR